MRRRLHWVINAHLLRNEVALNTKTWKQLTIQLVRLIKFINTINLKWAFDKKILIVMIVHTRSAMILEKLIVCRTLNAACEHFQIDR